MKIKIVSILILSILISCSSGNENDSSENQNLNDSLSYNTEEVITFEEIFRTLEAVKLYDDGKINFLGYKNAVSITSEKLEQMSLLDDPHYDLVILFLWKIQTDDWDLICIKAERMLGMSDGVTDYYFVSLNKDLKKIDELLIAEIYSGAESEDVEDPVVRYESNSFVTDKGRYIVDKKGNFSKDTGPIDPIGLSDFKSLFKKSSDMPFEINSKLISVLSENDNKTLHAGHVMTLKQGLIDIANIYGKGMPETFIKIDSLKKTGNYNKFLQEDNDGEVIESRAYALYDLKLDDGTTVFIWTIYDATPESGPYSKGTVAFASFVINGEIFSTYPIAESSWGGDSPMWQEKEVICTINKKGEFLISYKEVLGDDESGNEDLTKKDFSFIFEDGELKESNK